MGSEPLTAETLDRLRAWFRREARVFPWSTTDDPYAIWISEIMLQQTVVSAALGPYQAWMTRWPTLGSLAAAPVDDVLRAWEGLGYASRARNLHRAAQTLVAQGATTLPDTEAALRALPGIGDYTAAALLSFAFHQPALTLDANLKRVFQRLDGEPEWTPSVEARWRGRWKELVDGAHSRESNQAVMQLGQQLCRSSGPVCLKCVLQAECRAFQEGTAAQIPAPKERTILEKTTSVVFWHRPDRSVWWFARPLAGRFSNLWMAPPWEAAGSQELSLDGRRLSARTHTYTRYRDRLTPWMAPWSETADPPLPPGWTGRWVTPGDARSLGMVSVYRRIFEEATEPTLW